MNLRLLVAALVVAASAASCTNRVPAGAPQSIRIATWNLRYLGPSNQNRAESRSPQDLADYVAESGAAVIALTEVGETPGTPLKNSTLDAALGILRNAGNGDWEYMLFPTQDDRQVRMTGVAWNKSLVRRDGEPYKVPVATGQMSAATNSMMWGRVPHAVKFTTGANDFVIVPIHLQPNQGPGDNMAHRVAEARELVRHLPDIASRLSDRDVILIGDFGAPVGTETTVRLLTQAGYQDLNDRDVSTHLSGAAFERAFVPADQPEFQGIKMQSAAHPSLAGENFRTRLSDHYIAYFELKLTGDDD
jgi:hypothetical protein